MATIREQLVQHRFFRTLPDALIDRIADHTTQISFAVGDNLIRADEPADRCYAIQSGRVAVGIHVPHTGLKVLETLQSGDLLGWSWLFGTNRWTFDGEAVKAGSALVVEAQPLRDLLATDPTTALPLVLQVAEVMNERLQSARSRLMNIYGDEDDH